MILTFPAIWWAWSPPLTIVRFRDDPLGSIIVAEASLSFLGFGLPPGVPSWAGC